VAFFVVFKTTHFNNNNNNNNNMTVANHYSTFKNENLKYRTQLNNQYTILYTLFNAVIKCF